MPYSVPTATDVEQHRFLPLTGHDNHHDTPRHHRRSSSNSRFSNEKSGPGAFAPINNLPRRKSSQSTSPPPAAAPRPTRPMFQFPQDSSGSDDDDDDGGQAPPSTHTPRLSVDTHVKPTPPTALSQSPVGLHPGSIPFPTRGPASPQPPSSPSRTPSPLPRTPSTSSSSGPILLANGKPLRPSLKSSLSSPHLPPAAQSQNLHLRSQSAPSTPNLSPSGSDDSQTPIPTPKNVHFKEDGGLETVRVFHKAGKPVNISREEETETETEGYDSSSNAATGVGVGGVSRFPFPSFPFAPSSAEPLALAAPPLTSSIPALPPQLSHAHPVHTTPASSTRAPSLPPPHVLITSLSLTSSPPYALKGALLVLNVAYEKHVTVRFTLDDWCTTSEVGASWDGGGVLPPSWARRIGVGLDNDPSYDTFTFTISLHDLYLSGTLPTRVLYLAARYTVPGAGEWWDNNAGANYRVAFQPQAKPAPQSQSAPPKRPVRPGMTGRSLSSPAAAGSSYAKENTGAQGLPTLGSLNLGSRKPAPRPWERATSPPDASSNASIKPDGDEPGIRLGSISRGTGFSSFTLPPFGSAQRTPTAAPAPGSAPAPERITPPTSPYSTTKLTLRNYASPTVSPPAPAAPPARAPTPPKVTSPLPTPPASRSSSLSDLHAPVKQSLTLVGGHPATVVEDGAGGKDSYAALLARWCFHTSGPAVGSRSASADDVAGLSSVPRTHVQAASDSAVGVGRGAAQWEGVGAGLGMV